MKNLFYKPWITITFVTMLMFGITVNAMPVTVDSGSNFFFSEFYVNDVGGNVNAYGVVNTIRNSGGVATYDSIPGKEVTFEFGSTYSSTGPAGPVVISEYTDTYMNFYYDDGTGVDFNPATGTGYTDGVLLLDLIAHDFISALTGDLIDLDGFTLGGFGFLAAVFDVGNGGGLLNSILDTNGVTVAGGIGNGDLDFTASFSDLQGQLFAAENTGTADLRGLVQQVPEPGLLALLGIGLIALGSKRRYVTTV